MKYKSLETLIRGVLTEGASADMDRNTEKRRTVVNVGRLDPTPSRFKPTSEKSKLAKTGEIMTKVIDEADDIDWGKLSDPIHNVEIKDKKTGTSIWNTSHRARDKQHALEIAKAKVAREGKKPEDYTFTHVNEEVGLEEDALSNLAKLNTHIKDINVIKPGDKINLPGGKSYTVASGDTMSAIASGRYKGTAPTSGPELGKGPDSRMAAPSGQPTTVPSEPTKTSEPSTASTPAKEPPKDPDLSGNDRLKSAYDFASKFDGSEIGSPLTGTPAGTRTGSLAGDMSKIGIKNGKLKSDDDDKDTTNEDYDIVKDKSDRSSTQKTDSPRIVSGGKTPINLNPRLDTSPGDPDKPVKAKKMFKDQSGQPVKEDQDPSHYNAVGSGLRDKMRAFVRRNRDQTEKSKTQQQINLLKPKNEETTMTDNLLSEKELAAIAEIASQFDEARKKGTKEDANKPSIGDQRGEKGDQSGDNPTNNTARYDISDEVVTEKLVGKQKKIDKNHNGKIDAQDFELLRKEEEQVDETSAARKIKAYATAKRASIDPDNYDLYGTKTSSDYSKQADRLKSKIPANMHKDADNAADIAINGRKNRKGGPIDYLDAKSHVFTSKFNNAGTKKGTAQRKDYLQRNTGRFANEEEQIDELSPATLSSYEGKAITRKFQNARDQGRIEVSSHPAGWDLYNNIAKDTAKREKGLAMANKKLAKANKKSATEEVEQVYESRDINYHREKKKQVEDQIDKIVKSGGKVGLNDPLSKKLDLHTKAIQQIKKLGEEEEQVYELDLGALKNTMSKPNPLTRLRAAKATKDARSGNYPVKDSSYTSDREGQDNANKKAARLRQAAHEEVEQVDEYTSQISKKFTPNHTMKPGSSKGNYTQPGSDQGRHQGSVHTNTSTGSKNKPAISTPAPAPKKPSPADLKGKQDRLIYTKPDKLSPSEIRSKSRMEEVEQVTTLTADQLKQFNAVLEAEAAKRGRGRPKKNVEGDEPRPEGRDPREHIQVQAGRAMAGVPVNFKHDDGSMTKLTAPMGRQITTQLNALKPAARQDAVSKIHGSASGLRDVMGIK